jgi:hypothetical protein
MSKITSDAEEQYYKEQEHKEDELRKKMWAEQDKKERKTQKEIYNRAIEQEKENQERRTLKNVYETIDKWLHMKDKRRVDLILAIALSNKEPGTALWLIILDGLSSLVLQETLKAR